MMRLILSTASHSMWRAGLLAAASLVAFADPIWAQTSFAPNARNVQQDTAHFTASVTSRRLIVERPTLLSAGFEWMIDGDANRTAKVDVFYREKSASKWLPALPMMRLQNEHLGEDTGPSRPDWLHPPLIDYTAPNAFSGSVLNLKPGTAYEFRFVLSDPDGVSGEAEKFANVVTRSEPMPAVGGHIYHVYPADWKGSKQQPAFTGLLAAYQTGQLGADYWNGYPMRVQPGDVILVHAGVYKDDSYKYYQGFRYGKTSYGLFFDGTYYLRANGTPDKPIVIKAAGDGEVVFDGDGAAVLFDLTKANYNYFEGITVRNAGIAFDLGRKGYWGADGFTLKHSRIEDVGRGVRDDWANSKDFYIADNVFIGRHDRTKLAGRTPLYKNDLNYPPPITGPGGSEFAVKVYGEGHVVAYNYVEGWHDGIDIATYGNPDAEREEDLPASIDFYGNDLTNFDDNCFEMDGGARNIRFFQNRCFNDGATPFSVDPGFGGPFYYFRNLIYNAVSGTGIGGINASGVLYYQNTTIGELDAGALNAHFLNNLIIASASHMGGKDVPPPVFSVTTQTNYTSSDYNGFRPNPGAEVAFRWSSPPKGVLADFDLSHKFPVQNFTALKAYSAATGQDNHSVIVGYDIFVHVTPPDPRDIHKLYDPKDFNFSLMRRSKAVDAGVRLPTINDDFTGKAPDLGAFELGKPMPHYGPRP